MRTAMFRIAFASCCMLLLWGCSKSNTTVSKNVGGFIHPNSCVEAGNCPTDPQFNVSTVMSLSTGSDENPEIIRFIPGTVDRAVVISSSAKKLTMIEYTPTSFKFGPSYTFTVGGPQSETTSISVAPNGKYLAMTDARADCKKGFIHLVDLDKAPGTILASVEVGYNPDSAAFSPDGMWLVTADEDDREDRPCKPAERKGGTVTVIDLSNGAANASVVKTIPIDWDTDSEPEGIKIAPDSDTVVLAVQETSQLAFFKLSEIDTPGFGITDVLTFVDDQNEPAGEPDGLAISDDGKLVLVGLEKTDSFALVSLTSKTLIKSYNIKERKDVPNTYNRDLQKPTKQHEPEDVGFIRAGGALFALIALQESHGVAVYRVSDPSNPTFDSIAPVGVDYSKEVSEGLNEKSVIGPEGLAVNPLNGIIFTANEREGSITMLKSDFTVLEGN